MSKWKKPSGNILETNDEKATIEYCEAIGLERITEEVTQGDGDGTLQGSDPEEPEVTDVDDSGPRRGFAPTEEESRPDKLKKNKKKK